MEDKPKYQAGIASNATKNPQRVVFITPKTSANVKGDGGRRMMAYPNLIVREAIVLQVMIIALVIVALFWDAPLEQLANPLLTPNPAKAPWYFLGLQELLHYFPPVVAGIIIPTLVVVALIVIPYFNINVQGRPLWKDGSASRILAFLAILAALLIFFAVFEAWTLLIPTALVGGLAAGAYLARKGGPRTAVYLSGRPISWWIMTWFISVALILTVVGAFFRGPGWSWIWPWR